MSSTGTNSNPDPLHERPIPVSTSTSTSNSSKPTDKPKHKNESSKDEPAEHDDDDDDDQQPQPPSAAQSPRRSQAFGDSDSDADADADDGDGDTERDHTENHRSVSPTPKPPGPKHGTGERETGDREIATITSKTTDEMNLREELEPFDWEALEARFVAEMEECSREEEELGEEFGGWVELFKVWSASTAKVHGSERGRKRLRTRIASVQSAEQQFEEKRQHYIKVVQAFESALALLGGF